MSWCEAEEMANDVAKFIEQQARRIIEKDRRIEALEIENARLKGMIRNRRKASLGEKDE